MQKADTNTAPIKITQTWKRGIWGFRDTIEVEAEQVPIEEDPICIFATAKVVIKVNGEVKHTVEIPWHMPKAEIGLLTQVYMLSQHPSYIMPVWQPIMEKFCRRTPGFKKPDGMYFIVGDPFD